MTGSGDEIYSQLRRIEEAVRRLSARIGPLSTAPVEWGADLGALARLLYRERRLRDEALSAPLRGEGMWDVMLDLYASASEGRDISVSSACVAAAVPSTTALRQIDWLIAEGLVARRPSASDARRIWLCLTETGQSKMDQYLIAVTQLRAASSP